MYNSLHLPVPISLFAHFELVVAVQTQKESEYIHTHTAALYVWAPNLRLRLFGLVARFYTVAFPEE